MFLYYVLLPIAVLLACCPTFHNNGSWSLSLEIEAGLGSAQTRISPLHLGRLLVSCSFYLNIEVALVAVADEMLQGKVEGASHLQASTHQYTCQLFIRTPYNQIYLHGAHRIS